MKSINKLFYVISLLMILSSCVFYSLKGTIPVHIKNVYIQPIKNNSIDQEVVNLLDIQLSSIKEFLQEDVFICGRCGGTDRK